MRLKQCIVANETPIDQPNVHHIDNSTVNNDTSDSTIDNDTNNQLENAKNIENNNNSYSNPKVFTSVEGATFQNSQSQNAVETMYCGK